MQVADRLKDHGIVERPPLLEGRQMIMIMNPVRQAQAQAPAPAPQPAQPPRPAPAAVTKPAAAPPAPRQQRPA
jgi:hypothetical protein